MLNSLPLLLAQNGEPASPESGLWWMLVVGIGAIAAFMAFVVFVVAAAYGKLWFQAFMSRADVSMLSLIGMGFRQVKPNVIVTAKVMCAQAGLDIDRHDGISTSRLEAHYLAGGNVMNVVHAIIAAHRANIDLDFDRARQLLSDDAALESPTEAWTCRYCGESNEGQFAACWNCGTPADN